MKWADECRRRTALLTSFRRNLFERPSLRADAHLVAHVKLQSQCLRFQGVQSFAHDVLAVCRDVHRSHVDKTMIGVIVRVYEFCQNADVTPSALCGKITMHLLLQHPVESRHYGCFDVFVFAGVKFTTVNGFDMAVI